MRSFLPDGASYSKCLETLVYSYLNNETWDQASPINMLVLTFVSLDVIRRTSLHRYRSADNSALVIELQISTTLHSLTTTASRTRKHSMNECVPVSFFPKC
jgi:hypothetical protein